MYILGIACYYHDASACLLKDGKLIAAAEEERFTRKKHDSSFPINAINYCLKEGDITINDVDYIGFYEKPLLKFERILSQHLEMFPKSFMTFFNAIPVWINEKLRVVKSIKKKLKYKKDILFIEHHLAHAASSYLVSPFKEAAIVTIDGVGEWATTTYGYGKENDIKLIKEIKFPHSLGLLYSTITAHLGFSVNNSEYKVMGLAPYGKPIYYNKLKKVIDVKDDGSYRMNMDYFTYQNSMKMPSKKFIKEFGLIRNPSEKVSQYHKDLAASLQKLLEDIVYKILNHVHKKIKSENLCLAGGVALNSVMNGKIIKNTEFKNIYINPNPGDGGASIGAAYYIYNTILNKKRDYILKTAYLGPEYSDKEIKIILIKNRIKYTTFKNNEELLNIVSNLIYKNNIIGWFQGRMEFGPRALGGRSILANPCNPEIKDILNLKVKHREHFRPFAPTIPIEDVDEYFIADNPLPIPTDFMLMVYHIKKNKQNSIPAVTHIDGSGRLQSVRRKYNSLYYNLIKKFGELSGVPILINTSFNIRGEPIVCNPYDAYKCMMGTGIDYLVAGKYLIKREDNPKDIWDSEKFAKD